MKQLKARISLIILLMITVPVIVHTRSLLLQITQVDGPRWVLEVYAIFFAVAFDCSIFMFALYKKREQAIAFAVISGIVGWLFWCSDLVFVQMQAQASGAEWARLVMGTVWAGFSAYLVFWCSEIVAESFGEWEVGKKEVGRGKREVGRGKLEEGGRKKEVGGGKLEDGKGEVGRGKLGVGRKTDQQINGNNKHDQAMALKEQGLTVAEIARQLGVSDRTVRRYQQNGVS